MSKILRYSILISLILFIFSCKTDFNPNAPYQDITVVYGLLNQNDSISYIKINKAFLGNASAYVMAQNPDSSSYGNNLDVKLVRSIPGLLPDTLQFDTTTIYNKDPGIFYAPNQVIYKCVTYHLLDPSYGFNLLITNKKTGKVITSSTQLVNTFQITAPDANLVYMDFSKTGKRTLAWQSAANGRLYQPLIRFYYTETNQSNITVQKSIDWVFSSQKSASLIGGENMSTEYYGSEFYQVLQSNIPVNHNLIRKAGKLEVIFTVAADELSTYLDVNAPSTSIVQISPQYTNINNGIGVFSSRYDNQVNDPRILDLNSSSLDTLKYGQYTNGLGFQ